MDDTFLLELAQPIVAEAAPAEKELYTLLAGAYLEDPSPAAVRARAATNQLVLHTRTLLVPCLIADPGTAYLGPWLRPPSTPCLRCFSADLLPDNDLFRLDEIVHQPGPKTHDDTPIGIGMLRKAQAILTGGLPGHPERSVWGRVLFVEQHTTDLVITRSWRALKDPRCPHCREPQAESGTAVRLSRVLHENTKLHDYFHERDSIDATATGVAAESAATADRTVVELPDVATERSVPIEDAVLRRRSRRRFGTGGMTCRDIAALLYFAAGVTGWARTTTGGRMPLRASPSGGALYPICIYVYPRHVADLAPALYRYDPLEHALVECGVPVDQCEQISAHSAHYQVLNQAATVFVLAGAFECSQRKYLERGYRLVLLEAGHIAQNLQLIATARQLSTCGVAGFVDDIVNETLGFTRNGPTQALYLLAVGPPQQPQGEHGARSESEAAARLAVGPPPTCSPTLPDAHTPPGGTESGEHSLHPINPSSTDGWLS